MICPLCQTESKNMICACGFHFMGNCRRCNTSYRLIDKHKCKVKLDIIKVENATFQAFYHRSMVGNHCLQLLLNNSNFLFDLTLVDFLFTLSGDNAVNTIERLNRNFRLNLPLRPLTKDEIEQITIEGTYNVSYTKDGYFNRLQRVKRIDEGNIQSGYETTGCIN